MAMDVPDIVEDVAGALHSVQDSAGAALNSSVGRVQDMGEALHSAAASVGRVQEVGTVLHSAAASMGRVQEVGTALHSAAASAGRVQEVGTALHSAAASVGRVAHTLPLPGVPTEPTGLPPETPKEDRDRLRLEEQLAKLKVERSLAGTDLEAWQVLSGIKNMISTVEYNLGELMHESRMIYFTNQQALHFSDQRMPEVHASWMQKVEVLAGAVIWQEQPRNVIAREVLLPVAHQTEALIVGRSSCSLTNAFAEVSEPLQNSLGDQCKFQLVIFEHARNLQVNTKLKPDSLERKLQDSNDAWKRADFIPALSHHYGIDPVLWPRHQLVEGAAAYFLFECLNDQGLHDPRAAVQFENMFLSSLRKSVPVLALWTGGDVNVLKFEALNYITNGIPLILLDSRYSDEEHEPPAETTLESRLPRDPLDDISMHVDEKTTRKSFASEPFHEACQKLQQHAERLNSLETPLYDTHIGSALACVRAGIHRKDNEKKQRKDRELWLHEAIVQAMLEGHHTSAPTDLRRDEVSEALSAADKTIIKATDFFVDFVAQQTEQESRMIMSKLEEAISAISDCDDWDTLQAEWKRRWAKTLHYYAVFSGWEDVKVDDIPVLEVQPHNDWQAQGRYSRVILNRRLENDFERAHNALKAMLSSWLEEAKGYDRGKKRAEVVKSDKRLWLAAYEVLKSHDVDSCELSDHRRLRNLVQKHSRSDRLPDNSSLEGLLLLRCAWTLADVFNEKAARLKLIAKLSFACLLLLGVVITFVTTSAWTAEMSEDAKKFTVLGLGLASSSLAAWTTFTDPTKQWMKLRTACQRLQAEIWMFRTRVGDYGRADFTHISVGSDEGERQAEERFRDNIFAIADAALGPKDQFANHLTTDEVCIRVDGEKHNKEDRIDMMNERLKASNLTPAHHSHKQYPEIKSDSDKLKTHPDQETHPGADRDSHHAPASPEEYIIWRLSPLRAFYGRRIPQVRRTRLLMQIFFMASTSATAVLAAADQTAWTPIVVAISAALASWQEFRGVDMKLERYGAVVATLRNLMLWWQTLPEADKANVRHIERLVGRCEMAASSELAAWLSDAQQEAIPTPSSRPGRGQASSLASHSASVCFRCPGRGLMWGSSCQRGIVALLIFVEIHGA
ncbi:unnamed protein product [Symbiodinium sp. KB8]|nr:unnamed protein product [Symbiodinium sp. KB8]